MTTKRTRGARAARRPSSGALDQEAPLPALPARARDSHKGDFGRVLVIAGSTNMPGAALLATLGALRGGAGLVTLATVKDVVPWLVGSAPPAMFVGLPSTGDGGIAKRAIDTLRERIAVSDVVALGPGLGRSPETSSLVRAIVARCDKPLVLDADGLNAFEGHALELATRACPIVLTPHPGEFARLDDRPAPREPEERRARAMDFARRTQSVVLLKGAGTVITDGARTRINRTGNPGMATGGAGDVLTGLIAALLSRLPPFEAAALGAHVHGLAGDLAARDGSRTTLIATDLLATLPRAFKTLERR